MQELNSTSFVLHMHLVTQGITHPLRLHLPFLPSGCRWRALRCSRAHLPVARAAITNMLCWSRMSAYGGKRKTRTEDCCCVSNTNMITLWSININMSNTAASIYSFSSQSNAHMSWFMALSQCKGTKQIPLTEILFFSSQHRCILIFWNFTHPYRPN